MYMYSGNINTYYSDIVNIPIMISTIRIMIIRYDIQNRNMFELFFNLRPFVCCLVDLTHTIGIFFPGKE